MTPPRERVRLFVAVWPDTETVARLRALERPDEPGVRWVPESNWHVTLRFVGDADPAAMVHLLHDADLPAATAVLGPAVTRLGSRQIVVPVSGLDDLAAAVLTATASVGPQDRRSFRGHLTIARTRGESSSVLGAPATARFVVDHVALVASDLQPTGAVYTTVETVPVGPASPPNS